MTLCTRTLRAPAQCVAGAGRYCKIGTMLASTRTHGGESKYPIPWPKPHTNRALN